MYVRVRTPQGIDNQAILVPQRAVHRSSDGSAQVMVVGADERAESRSVGTGVMQGSRWQITEGLVFSLIVQGLSELGYPILEVEMQEIIRRIDFSEVLMTWFLPALLFAGALHVDLSDLRSYKWPIGLLATAGVLIATFVIGGLAYYTTSSTRRSVKICAGAPSARIAPSRMAIRCEA